MRIATLAVLAVALPVAAADPEPEITRAAVRRNRLEPCTRCAHPRGLRATGGTFTGDATQPYRFEVVRTSPNCQAARTFRRRRGGQAPRWPGGWILNDVIRVPSATCPNQQPLSASGAIRDATPPILDAQGPLAHLPAGVGGESEGECICRRSDVHGVDGVWKARPAAASAPLMMPASTAGASDERAAADP
jgi:hypothetical protein